MCLLLIPSSPLKKINLFEGLLEDSKAFFFFFCLYVCAAFLQSKDSLG